MFETSKAVTCVVLATDRMAIPTPVLVGIHRQKVALINEPYGQHLEHRVMRHQPDIMLLWHVAGHPLPLYLMETMVAHLPVLVLGESENLAVALDALRAGALGYLLVESLAADLQPAASCARQGRRYLSPKLAGALLDLMVGGYDRDGVTLTRRQKDILRGLALGESVKEIAHRMGLSNKTVNAHRLNIKRRLGIGNPAGLFFYALREGIIDFPSIMGMPMVRR